MSSSRTARHALGYGLFVCTVVCTALAARADTVKLSEEEIVIPTYLAGDPEPNPMFYLGKGSQGAQGRVYPYPLYDRLTNIKSNKTYKILYLENEYVRIGVLPEIGGRLFEAVDKSNGYNFIYRQHVIKPALIGLIGAWISGGVEWNIPHHHRATTFLPVQYQVESNADDSKTVWVGELEVRHRMRWAVGYTLRPGKSYLECSVRIANRTPFANSMLCFANVAVHVNDQYQVIYPPGTRYVTFHAKREFTTWPVATTRYAGADFSRGVDVSWYTNHIAANSMFAWNYADDFFAGYDHGKQAGIMSVANHHIVPGKKFWTWGNGSRGRMWDKILTDDDGPYIELMVGAYSDNQPDYSWLQPYETRSFEMYWYPFREIGGVKKANLEAAVNLEVHSNRMATVGFCTTAVIRSARATLKAGERVLLEESIRITPAQPFVKNVSLPADVQEHELRAVLSAEGRELISYTPAFLEPVPMPEPVKGPPSPAEMKTIEELYLAGQRIEQFHSPSQEPEPYWEEALQRDPGDARANTALGIRELKQMKFAEAEARFRRAIDRLTTNYTSPKDGEAFYYLGLSLQCQALCNDEPNDPKLAATRLDHAVDAYYKASWSQAWRSPAFFALAEIACSRGDLSSANELADRSLEANTLNLRALGLKAALLRHSGQPVGARKVLQLSGAKTDPLDVRLLTERWLSGDKKALGALRIAMRQHPHTVLEAAAEYHTAGLWRDGEAVLRLMVEENRPEPAGRSSTAPMLATEPLAAYYLAEFAKRLGSAEKAGQYRARAARMSPEYVFPFQWELLPVLRSALAINPADGRAALYLGALLFDGTPAEAVKFWQYAATVEQDSPLVHRNLAVAYAHQKPTPDLTNAISHLEKAVSATRKYPLHFAELDALYARVGASPETRLALLEGNHEVVARRDDALSREIGLKVFAGKYDEAIRLMTGRKFSVWEGGALEVTDHWVDAHLLRGRQRLERRDFTAALKDFETARTIPENLPTERDLGREAETGYWAGLAQEGLGTAGEAREEWQRSAGTQTSRRERRGGISRGLIQNYYRGLALRRLGKEAEAETVFRELLELTREGSDGTDDGGESPPSRPRSGLAHYLAGLAQLGLGNTENAKSEFEFALRKSPDLLGAQVELSRK